MNLSTMTILAGLNPLAASPVFRERPYRSRNAPFSLASEKIGRPPRASALNFLLGSKLLPWNCASSVFSIISVFAPPSDSTFSVSFSSVFSFSVGSFSLVSVSSVFPIVPSTISSIHSQPSIPTASTYRWILGAFCAIPSPTTRHIPPLGLLPSIRSRSRYPATSFCSVWTPSTMIGQFWMMCLTSFSFGVYWSPVVSS